MLREERALLETRGKPRLHYSLALVALLWGVAPMANSNEYRTWIEHHVDGQFLTVTAQAFSTAKRTLHYELRAQQLASSNRVATRQSGPVILEAEETLTLGRLRLGLRAAERYRIELRLLDGERLLAEEITTLP